MVTIKGKSKARMTEVMLSLSPIHLVRFKGAFKTL